MICKAGITMILTFGALGSGLIPAAGSAGGSNRQSVSIIPLPVSVEYLDGRFVLTPSTQVVAENEADAEASRLVEALVPAMGFRLKLIASSQSQKQTIKFELDENLPQAGDEGYELQATSEHILIRARKPAGLFYGTQTLLQLLPPQIFGDKVVKDVRWEVPCVRIVDYPRFQWRGLLVDPARHFIPVEDLLRFIGNMALHKFNSLQIHLTDDEGWRIEIKKYPKLTQVGALRSETLIGHMNDKPWRFDGKPHGGYYSQDDIRRIVRYAADRHIRIVPEIEMPGHARAAISSYPMLGVFPEKQRNLKPWTHWGVSEDIFAPRAETIEFLQNVLSEVMDLFPGTYIHIGGDEAVKNQWKASEEMQALIREKGLENEEQLQAWFTKQMDTFLAEHGRRLVGWDEILEGGLAPGAIVMSWRGESGGITAANSGHDVVMAPTSHTYFDYYQGPAEKEPLAIGGNLPLEKVYRYDPVPKTISPEKAGHVLGAQGQLWGEYISNLSHLEYMAYPRAAALAEVVWSQADAKDYEKFLVRLRHHLKRFDERGVNYRRLD